MHKLAGKNREGYSIQYLASLKYRLSHSLLAIASLKRKLSAIYCSVVVWVAWVPSCENVLA